MNRFDRQLSLANRGEKIVERWLQANECGVIQSYSFTGDGGNKAPRLHFAQRSLTIPDLDTARYTERWWVEVKTYEHAAPNRKLGEPVHGVKRKHYEDYLEVAQETGTRVLLAVLELWPCKGENRSALLTAWLDKIACHFCMCPACNGRASGQCFAPVKEQVYFRRSDFRERVIFDEDIDALRADWRGDAAE